MLIEEKSNGIMLLGVKNIISYKERCFRRLFSFLMIVNTIPLVYFFFLYIQSNSKVLLCVCIMLLVLSALNIMNGINECLFFIKDISMENGRIYIHYNEKNIPKCITIPLSNIYIKVFEGSSIVSRNLRLYYDKELKITQYAIQDWTPEVMQSVAQKIEELKKEYEQEHTNTNKH